MPITPFHFGLGLAVKSVALRHFSLVLFIAIQVVIDLESLYNLIRERYPVHRFLHTFVGATLLAILAALPAFSKWASKLGATGLRRFSLLLATTLFATWSHVVLDGVMHRDIRPFWPFTDRNPLLGAIDLGVLHLGLVALGLFGLIVWGFRQPLGDESTR